MQSHKQQTHSHESHMSPTSAWTVTLKFDNPRGELPVISNEAKGILINRITGSNVVVGTGKNYIIITLTVWAYDHRTAAQLASASCDDGLHAAGLPALAVADCRAARMDVVRVELEETPDLIGVSEIADLLGVSKQRAWQVTKTKSFPAVAFHPKAGPLWWQSAVVRAFKKPNED